MTDERGTFMPTNGPTTVINDADALAAAQAAQQAAATAMARANAAMQRANQAAQDAGNANVTLGQLATSQAAADATHNALAAQDALLQERLDQVQLTPGPEGPAGESAYQIARDHGYGGTETQWLATLRGQDGANGVGIKGDPGTNGTNGASIKGDRGDAGVNGTNGINGTNGSNATVTIATGNASTPLLALGGQQDVTVTLSKTMPSNTYSVDLILPTALIGNSTVTVKSKTTTAVVLTVKATLAVGAASIALVAWQ